MKKTDTEAFASEFDMSAGDNAASRKQINDSIISEATANEHSFRKAAMAGLNDIVGQGKAVKETPLAPLAPLALDETLKENEQ